MVFLFSDFQLIFYFLIVFQNALGPQGTQGPSNSRRAPGPHGALGSCLRICLFNLEFYLHFYQVFLLESLGIAWNRVTWGAKSRRGPRDPRTQGTRGPKGRHTRSDKKLCISNLNSCINHHAPTQKRLSTISANNSIFYWKHLHETSCGHALTDASVPWAPKDGAETRYEPGKCHGGSLPPPYRRCDVSFVHCTVPAGSQLPRESHHNQRYTKSSCDPVTLDILKVLLEPRDLSSLA